QDVPRTHEESWERTRNRPEPTGIGLALTSAGPLPFALQFPLSKTPTASSTRSRQCQSFPVANNAAASRSRQTSTRGSCCRMANRLKSLRLFFLKVFHRLVKEVHNSICYRIARFGMLKRLLEKRMF